MTEAASTLYSHPLEKRRRSGIYYTPNDVATKITRWAVPNRDAVILDPCFGGCAFLNAGFERLRDLAATSPARQLYGADRDRMAIKHIKPFLKEGAHRNQFHFEDFLLLRPFHFDAAFSSIVGNPPYIKHHNLSRSRIDVARRAIGANHPLSRKASYWAYFVLHAISFLQEGGRMGLVLPGAFMHADYAAVIRKHLARTFRQVTVVVLMDRLFSDAEESSVLLLADERANCNAEVRVLSSCVDDLELNTRRLLQGDPIPRTSIGGSWTRTVVEPAVMKSYVTMRSWSKKLGSIAAIHIGTVTGANDFFVVSPSTAKKKGLSAKTLHPILTRAAYLKGLELSESDVQAIACSDRPCFLILPPNRGKTSKAVRRWIAEGKRNDINHHYKCAVRTPWYRVSVESPPDAFLSYMSGLSPRLVLNRSGATSTNAIHRVLWKRDVSPRQIAVGFLSSVTQLSCEIEGRFYGGGVLKLEPSDAARVLVPMLPVPVTEKWYKELHELCIGGKHEEATRRVDALLVRAGLISQTEVNRIRKEIKRLRSRRLTSGST